MATEQQDAEWRDEANWRGGFLRLYVAPRDRRLLVPMHPRWLGWTPNWGRRETWLLLIALYVVMGVILFLFAKHHGFPGSSGSPRL